MADRRPRVKFSVRRSAGGGRWWYESVTIPEPSGGVFTPMAEPPRIGDLISLWVPEGALEGGPMFRVVARQWAHASWGSRTWPYGEPESKEGPMLDIILEPVAQGVYADETDICAEPSCEAVMMNGDWWFPPGASEPEPHDHTPYREE